MPEGARFVVSADWSDFERMAGEMEGVPDRVAYLMAYEFEGIVKEEAPKGVTGALSANWTVSQEEPGAYMIRSGQEYSLAVNDGTRPHAPPMDAIQEWAEFRGLPWFPVWLGIVRRGTKANPYVDRSMERTEGRIPLLVNQALGEMKQ